MSPCRNWDSPNPSPAGECALPAGPKGGGGAHSPAAKGVGESQFRRLEKKLSTMPTLWLLRVQLGRPCRQRTIYGNHKLIVYCTVSISDKCLPFAILPSVLQRSFHSAAAGKCRKPHCPSLYYRPGCMD